MISLLKMKREPWANGYRTEPWYWDLLKACCIFPPYQHLLKSFSAVLESQMQARSQNQNLKLCFLTFSVWSMILGCWKAKFSEDLGNSFYFSEGCFCVCVFFWKKTFVLMSKHQGFVSLECSDIIMRLLQRTLYINCNTNNKHCTAIVIIPWKWVSGCFHIWETWSF